MSSSITLSAATRQNLLSLQETAALAATNQNRLSTGKKVNSALDNPVNFFTAQSLSDRSSALSGLLDGISNGIQTIQAANTGASKIADLVKSLQSTIAQAQSDAAVNRPTATGSALTTIDKAKLVGTSLRTTVMNMALGGTKADPSESAAGSVGITGDKVAVTLTDGENTFTKTLDKTATVGDLVNAINSSGLATAAVDDAGKLTVTGNSDTLKVGIGGGADADAALTKAEDGDSNDKLGLTAAAYKTGLTNDKTSAARTALASQFNDLRTQIDQIAKDAGFNGTNLLGGDALSVIFNEKTGSDQSKLTIAGRKLTAESLGVDKAVNGTAGTGEFNIQTDKGLTAMQDTLKTALASLKSLQSGFGSNLSNVQVRQDFTKQLGNILDTGAANLVNADMNEEAANSQALSTRQSLGVSALSLANTAQQGILQLLR
ncbi:flagellin N-terminal helical domain-containing protein [Methylorubrum extorquens]|uniref:flagellin N-terminal helical domain-containing protein n=1 Tax=Methylorubrum extorquens TaxID=408 RepID=UPI001EE54E30|nr:flagellin [Methylorubrum extorquens]MCG5244852.1 flagellin [Methylorubrum extorquens]